MDVEARSWRNMGKLEIVLAQRGRLGCWIEVSGQDRVRGPQRCDGDCAEGHEGVDSAFPNWIVVRAGLRYNLVREEAVLMLLCSRE